MDFQIVAAVLLGVRREREANEGLQDEFNDDKCPEKVDTHVFSYFFLASVARLYRKNFP
jgi:hypothetical protein